MTRKRAEGLHLIDTQDSGQHSSACLPGKMVCAKYWQGEMQTAAESARAEREDSGCWYPQMWNFSKSEHTVRLLDI